MKIFMLELTNICPNNCYYCSHGIMTRAQGFMSIETVNKVIEYTDTEYLLLSCNGESILHPEIDKIINLLHDNGIKTEIDINSNTLTASIMNLAVSLPFYKINISVDVDTDSDLIKGYTDKRLFITAFGRDRASVVALRKVWGNNIHFKYMRNFFGALDFDGEFYPFKEECKLIKHNIGAVMWNGDLCACPYDYDNIGKLGTIDDVNTVTNIGIKDCKECMEYVSNHDGR